MGAVMKPQRRRLVLNASFAAFVALLFFYLYVNPHSQSSSRWSLFTSTSPSSHSSPQSPLASAPPDLLAHEGSGAESSTAPSLPCEGLEGAEDVYVLLKTGARESHDAIPLLLNNTFRCIPRYGIYSDLEEEIQGHKIHDILNELPTPVLAHYPDFEIYREIRRYKAEGLQNYTKLFDVPPGMTKEDAPGWKLDKWKFLPLLEAALRNEAKWYFFVESDTHIVWSNLLRWLNQLDHTKKMYIGGATWFGEHILAHGGNGYIMSRPTVEIAVQTVREHEEKYMQVVDEDCCGDSAISTLINYDLDIELMQSWPMLQGETISSLDYTERQWCYPVVTQHHMHGPEIVEMWLFEQEWLANPSVNSRPITHKDTFKHFLEPYIIGEEVLYGWDNISNDEKITDPGDSKAEKQGDTSLKPYNDIYSCEEECRRNDRCVQFSWIPGQCNLGFAIRFGAKVDPSDGPKQGMISAWMTQRVEEFRRKMGSCDPKWILKHGDSP